MKLYVINKWNQIYENNRSRSVDDLTWVKIPNRHDGENYSLIMAQEKASEIFAAFILMVQVASRCQPRGVLIRDNKMPHTAETLSVKTRACSSWFELAFNFLENHTDWLMVLEVMDGCQVDVSQLSVGWRAGDEEGKGREGNGREENARQLLVTLNELTGRKFLPSRESMTPILARLAEPGVTIEGCEAMIRRQVILWKGNPEMEEYLRPSTLFRPQKFNNYYAAKDQPAKPYDPNQRNGQPGYDRNEGTFNKGLDFSHAAKRSQERKNV